jgi:hypothetical protein
MFRLVPLVGCLYLNFVHVILVFFLILDQQRSSSSLQHTIHNHINIRHVNLLSHHHFRINNSRIYFVDNKFKKTNYIMY